MLASNDSFVNNKPNAILSSCLAKINADKILKDYMDKPMKYASAGFSPSCDIDVRAG